MPSPSGIVDKNQANKSEGRHIHNYSTFDRSLSYRLYNTHRFGDYTPTFVMEGVPQDEISLNSRDSIDSLSLKAPFKGSIRKIKESFMVPNMAILPLQWDRIYAQNSNGDDVPLDANCVLLDFPTKYKNLFQDLLTNVNSLAVNSPSARALFATAIMRLLVIGEYVYSKGSLMNVLGYKAWTQLTIYNYDSQAQRLESKDYDWWFEQVVGLVFGNVASITVSEPVGSSTVVHNFYGLDGISSTDPAFNGYEPFRGLFELFRENPLCYITALSITGVTESTWETMISGERGTGYGLFSTSSFRWNLPSSSYTGDPEDETSLNPNILNLSRLLAYQLICAHFYSNSSIDFIYSADLYREYINFIESGIVPTGNTLFNWNGMQLPFDYLSGRRLSYILLLDSSNTRTYITGNLGASPLTQNYGRSLAAFAAIFGFRHSLRYGDYFTASRPRPLAPINTDVSVNNNLVSVIDITRRIQAQRFGNAVMRSRSKIEEYVKSLFGRAPQPDYHNPFFLIRQEEIIFGDYVQNTSNNQNPNLPNTRTANFTGNLDRHTFTFHNNDQHPCIYMQIVSYDTPRAYTRSVERQFLHADRFDMFNPDFQYIGDQPIYGIELGYFNTVGIPNIFAYTTRDMEYKQRYDQASGGFVSGSLPGWAFTDERLSNYSYNNLSPDFIRSRNTDIDYLYLSLSSYSLGRYFHFTCVTDNNVRAKRAMAVDPQILG